MTWQRLRQPAFASGSSSESRSYSALIESPRTITITGKTDLHNQYHEGAFVHYRSNGSTKERVYSTARTKRTASNVAAVHALLATSGSVYFITHTARADWDDAQRRAAFRKLVDRIRKIPYYAGSMWTTERHKSGKLHHHLVVRSTSYWDYTKLVNRWSIRYCGSVNGLKIDRHHGSDSASWKYGIKSFAYGIKGQGTADKLPFRWWGTSKVVRYVKVPDHELPILHTMASKNRWRKCAYVPKAYAHAECARMTRAYESGARKFYTLHPRTKPYALKPDELLSVQLSSRADDSTGYR